MRGIREETQYVSSSRPHATCSPVECSCHVKTRYKVKHLVTLSLETMEMAIPFPAARPRMPTAKLQQERLGLPPYRHTAAPAAAGCSFVLMRVKQRVNRDLTSHIEVIYSFILSAVLGMEPRSFLVRLLACELHPQPISDIFKGSILKFQQLFTPPLAVAYCINEETLPIIIIICCL